MISPYPTAIGLQNGQSFPLGLHFSVASFLYFAGTVVFMVTVEMGGSDCPSGICTILTYIGALNGAASRSKIIWALFPVAHRRGPRAQFRARCKTNTRLVMAALWMRLKDTVVFYSFAPPLKQRLQGESEGYSVIRDFLIPFPGRYVKI